VGQTNDKSKSVRRSGPAAVRQPRFDSSRFVQYELDKNEAAQCKGWVLESEDLWLELLALLDDGYSASLKFDTFSEAYACFLQVRGDPDHPNAGLVLAGRGSTPAKALKQAIFKHKAIGPSWVRYAEREKPVIDD